MAAPSFQSLHTALTSLDLFRNLFVRDHPWG
jgi:hypothetical protein